MNAQLLHTLHGVSLSACIFCLITETVAHYISTQVVASYDLALECVLLHIVIREQITVNFIHWIAVLCKRTPSENTANRCTVY